MSLNHSSLDKIRKELRNRRISCKKVSKEEKKNKKKLDHKNSKCETSQKNNFCGDSNYKVDTDVIEIDENQPRADESVKKKTNRSPEHETITDEHRETTRKHRQSQIVPDSVRSDVEDGPGSQTFRNGSHPLNDSSDNLKQNAHFDIIAKVNNAEDSTITKRKKKRKHRRQEIIPNEHPIAPKKQRVGDIYSESETDDRELCDSNQTFSQVIQGELFRSPLALEKITSPTGQDLDTLLDESTFTTEEEHFEAGPLEIKYMKRQIKSLEKSELKINKKIDGLMTDVKEIKAMLNFQLNPVAAQNARNEITLLPNLPLKKLKYVYEMENNINQNDEYKRQLVSS